MKNAILMSIRSNHLCDILNGAKTIELRKRFPSDYRGWVYCYCTLKEPYLDYNAERGKYVLLTKKELDEIWYPIAPYNGKVLCRFWVCGVKDLIPYLITEFDLSQALIMKKACVSKKELEKYAKGMKALSISKLELFVSPIKLSEFFVDMDLEERVLRAPQSWQYVEVGE